MILSVAVFLKEVPPCPNDDFFGGCVNFLGFGGRDEK